MSGDRRTHLLAATCQVIARHGVRGLRVEQVAAKAGVSTTLLYYYFANRSGLLTATMEFVNDRAGAYTAAPSGLTGRQRLLHQLLGEFKDTDAVRENSAVWGEIRASAVFDTSLQARVKAATEVWNATVAEAIVEGQHDGSVNAGIDPAATAECLTALVEGLSNRWLTRALSTTEAHRHLHAQVTNLVSD